MKNKPAFPGRVVYWLAAAVILGLGGAGVWTMRAKAEQKRADPPVALRHEGERLVVPAESPLRRTLAVAPATRETVAAPFNLPAMIEADPAKLVKVLPPLAGRIVSLNKQLGDEVKAGDVLFTIDSADLAQANSDAAKARAAMTMARRNLDRQRELDKSEIAAKRDFEQAQSDYDQAASESQRADARLAQLGAKGGGTLQAGGGHILAVRSPINGRVVDLNAATGAYWNDTTASLMTVADLSHVFVTANAQEKDLGHVYVGQSATVKFDAYDDPQPGKVRYVGQILDADTRTTKVRMVFDNPDGRLRPGMFAQATFLSQPHEGIVVPMSAIVQSGFYTRAFVEVAPWQFEPRVIKLGAQIGDRMEVKSGLSAGDRVVVKEGVLLND
ncbi:zinc efflux RND transporter periplasmic adaptor subunit ZneB [Cupriavidus metallidurans]|uniref:Membrane fusion protein (MFP-RND) heavy metal cation tricomponent efflux HmxB (CzcB-like) n=1 Tax=Cupriavidus metallidurans (strain ATCC 43123 / DSM 2839 / NBRC 102507 / CH34) TaxID=266264 RepID=Q1LCD7_CUPMC|nr:zinc efflux RND transporter periplasmic adaptor subunit ZneB [Cupriavidus metallidurans]ABF12189.1 membrane fusion protein (MFP-RND) heavy metal cation tricomponent efflux HmxB (CzcB-like) [Cupriavidus metallidurans CH34]QGS33482.1 zinc efflux RND transporter periplasmic adaptor subunit ZneB [Cupriavidus metallidurans]